MGPARPLLRGLLGLAFGFGLSAAATPALAQGECTLLQKAKGDADLIVYFTKFRAEDKTGGRYRKCRIVTKAGKGTQTFRLTPFRRDANLVVLRSNWPRVD